MTSKVPLYEPRNKRTSSRQPNGKPGWLYLVRMTDGNKNPIKIGITFKDTPHRRLKVLESSTPYPIEVIGFHWAEDVVTLEAILHARYDAKHLNGEWFALSDTEIKDILREREFITDYELELRTIEMVLEFASRLKGQPR